MFPKQKNVTKFKFKIMFEKIESGAGQNFVVAMVPGGSGTSISNDFFELATVILQI